MPSVKVRENESLEVALRRFKRICEKAGILTELRRRETYEKPTTTRKRKRAAAVKRAVKKMIRTDPILAKAQERGRRTKTNTRGAKGKGSRSDTNR